ncbi:NADPH-dependent codeinone reductase 1-4-like isoform X2 [Salvia miltiorrhiza]|uniref:NADPH-dependent codeinone reductase 1-4-like isoform X2 n=1 Tax=Salvia miltiorrhiza TaxID=226208 RepID=UPI0025AC5E7A|nr:NADPH-dependent codeinone reductase 1-4-like isoform X2 [Salvia miltiorrhiza]
MASASIPEINLNSGTGKIPALGFGTASDPPVDSQTIKTAVLQAIELGYRHFDTAALYNSEQPLGEAIAEAVNRRLIGSRRDLFITSKLWCSDAHPQHVAPALSTTLKNLDTNYIDLYLIHWPVSAKAGKVEYPIKAEDFAPMEFGSVWAAMEECQRIGLTKAIGVSNFSSKKLLEILATAKIPPAVNQVALRWAYEQGIGVVMKSFNRERMKGNMSIFDWWLSSQEVDMISEIPQGRACLGLDYTSIYGPYKTIQQLWDEDI